MKKGLKIFGIVLGIIILLGVAFYAMDRVSKKQSKYEVHETDTTDDKNNLNLVTLNVFSMTAEDLYTEYTLSKEESTYVTNLITNMQCRNYTCDGIAEYHFKINNAYYGVEVFENEIHIIPYSDNIDNEAIIKGEDFIKLKEILSTYPMVCT